MPYDEAAELAAHAEKEGFSCLGTWSHEECQRLGKQLQNRDLVCRVVPFCEGGDRAWQARNMYGRFNVGRIVVLDEVILNHVEIYLKKMKINWANFCRDENGYSKM